MSVYAKLVNGGLEFAPKKTTRGRVVYSGSLYTDAMKIEDGYKLVVYSDEPSAQADIGYHWESGWAESQNTITQTWTQVANVPTIEEKIGKFLKENLKPIDTFNVESGNGKRYYALVFDNNSPEIETGDIQFDEELRNSIKKVPVTDSTTGQTVNYYIPLLSEDALARMGIPTV